MCVVVDPANVLVVTGLSFPNPGELDDLINRFAETRAVSGQTHTLFRTRCNCIPSLGRAEYMYQGGLTHKY